MPQAIGRVENGNGKEVRAAINKNLSALFSSNSGESQPANSFEGQTWLNTSASPARFEIKPPSGENFVPMRDMEGGVILPPTGYELGNLNAKPAIYFDGSPLTGFFEFADNVIGFARSGNVHYVLGRTLESQTNAFVIGPAAYAKTPLNPTNGKNNRGAEGFCVADTGQCHIGSFDRPLTVNKMFPPSESGTPSIINFHVNGTTEGSIRFNTNNGKIELFNRQNDYRVQENVTKINPKSARDAINKLKPIKFNQVGYKHAIPGFTAHEVQEALPQFNLTGEKDAVDSEGNPDHQHFDNDTHHNKV